MNPNSLYCVVIHRYSPDPLLDQKFSEYLESFIDTDDKNHVGGFDFADESIYFIDIDILKTMKIIDFFEKNNLLIKYERVSNIIDLINSDEKYLMAYSDDRNKQILDKYINENVSIDNILDRMLKNGLSSLLPVELEKLNQNR